MSKIILNPPRAKKWQHSTRQSPFPIPIGSLVGRQPSATDWQVYEGRLLGNRVVVIDPNHMDSLYHMGYFGKRSRSTVDWTPKEPSSDTSEVMDKSSKPDTSATNLTNCDAAAPIEDMMITDDDKSVVRQAINEIEPFTKADVLHLTLVEAFFLSFGLGCLLVSDNTQKQMNLEEMWTTFCQLDSFFKYKYITYHHFRSKGWVVRPGVKFGTHFILYKDGPPFYHASYSVITKVVDETLSNVVSQDNVNTDHGWSDLTGINRITEHVAKDLLFCYVIQPSNLSVDDMKHPSCIARFQVQEILLRRWVPSEERENDDNT